MKSKFDNVLILGIGGGGGKIIREINLREPGDWVKLVYLDSDLEDLEYSDGVLQVPLGKGWTRGLGCGGDAHQGENMNAAKLAEIRELLENAGLVIFVGCLGGGTASGALQVLNRLLREENCPGLSLVTLPLTVEGSERGDVARQALEALRRHEDAVIAVKNDLIFRQIPGDTPLTEALAQVNRLLADGILGLMAGIRCRDGIPIEFAKLQNLLRKRPAACAFGLGCAAGKDRAEAVVEDLLAAPMLGGEAFLRQADVVVGALSGGPDLTLDEMTECLGDLQARLEPGTRSVFGAGVVSGLGEGIIQLSLVALHYAKQDTPGGKAAASDLPPGTGEVTGVLGVFANSTPTIRRGENLDIPTFQRRGVVLEDAMESDNESGE